MRVWCLDLVVSDRERGASEECVRRRNRWDDGVRAEDICESGHLCCWLYCIGLHLTQDIDVLQDGRKLFGHLFLFSRLQSEPGQLCDVRDLGGSE